MLEFLRSSSSCCCWKRKLLCFFFYLGAGGGGGGAVFPWSSTFAFHHGIRCSQVSYTFSSLPTRELSLLSFVFAVCWLQFSDMNLFCSFQDVPDSSTWTSVGIRAHTCLTKCFVVESPLVSCIKYALDKKHYYAKQSGKAWKPWQWWHVLWGSLSQKLLFIYLTKRLTLTNGEEPACPLCKLSCLLCLYTDLGVRSWVGSDEIIMEVLQYVVVHGTCIFWNASWHCYWSLIHEGKLLFLWYHSWIAPSYTSNTNCQSVSFCHV